MKFFRKTDLLVMLVILAVAVGSYLVYTGIVRDRPAKAEIYYYQTLVTTIDLTSAHEETYVLPQNPHVIFHVYADGSICFEESDCPDQICVHAGRLRTIGQSAACLPNGVLLKIVPADGWKDDDVDLVVGK